MENRPRESVFHITNTSDALEIDTHVDSPVLCCHRYHKALGELLSH
jgi:hypothetical protein